MSSLTLTAAQRQTLLSLTTTSTLFQATQARLSSGKTVNSAIDDAVSDFHSQSLANGAGGLTGLKTGLDQSIQALGAAQGTTSAVEGLLNQLKGVLDGARGASLAQRTAATRQFTDIGNQLAQLVQGSSFQGINILASTGASLVTQLSANTAAAFTVGGYNLISSTGGNARSLFTQAGAVFNASHGFVFSQVVGDAGGTGGAPAFAVAGFSALDLQAGAGAAVPASAAKAVFAATETRLDNAITKLQGVAASLGTDVAVLQTRASFAADYANTLSSGASKLTLADLNTEAANSQALQLRQQLGIQSLSISGQQNQSILQLLR